MKNRKGMELTKKQDAMLSALEQYCQRNHTTAWIGSPQELEKLGGQDLLYQLEQSGVVTYNRIGEKWIVVPNRKAREA